MTVHYFSTHTAAAQTPAEKRGRPSEQDGEGAKKTTPAIGERSEQQSPARNQRDNPNQNLGNTGAMTVDNNDEVARTLYTTPAPRRNNLEEEIIDKFIDMEDSTMDGNVEKEMLLQVSNSARKLVPNDPKGSRNKGRVQVR